MATYEMRRYLLMTLDPVHIGTGGYRLGRVDSSIVREPGTRVPKIPGSSLHGAIRTYAARRFQNLHAAGKDQKKVIGPATDPVCYTFGYSQPGKSEVEGEDKETKAYSGVVNVFDAQILLFPVHTMYGPVWVTTKERLTDAGFTMDGENSSPASGSGLASWERTDPLNLGWLIIAIQDKISITPPEKWQGPRWDAIKDRIVVISDSLFSQVVNSNLEVRTSVSIDPWRGAAEDGALFTYEAIPRATFLVMDVVIDDYREAYPEKSHLENWLANNLPEEQLNNLKKQGWLDEGVKSTFNKKTNLEINWSSPADVFQAGLSLLAWLGVGGMGTRGFGRITIVGDPVTQT